ncbi:MAG: CelD/BcsL family acetyltransferase involved in cellulose biosynthesis, partial [Gammaproteobacteria bacterium]
ALVCEFKWTKVAGKFPVPAVSSGSHLVNDLALVQPDDTSVTAALIEAARHSYPNSAWLSFERLTPSCYTDMLQWARSSHYQIFHSESDYSAVFDVDDTTFEQHMAKLSKKSRTNFSYYRRLLSREVGPLQSLIICPDSKQQGADLLELFLQLEKTGWKGDVGSAIDQREESRAFYQAFCESSQNTNQIIWHQIYADDELLAMHLVVRSGKNLWVVKTAFNDAYRRYSPGSVALTDLLKFSIEQPDISSLRMITNYDWVWKWRPQRESYYGIRVHFPSVVGKMLSLVSLCTDNNWKCVKD